MNIKGFVNKVQEEYADYSQKWKALSCGDENHFLYKRAEIMDMASRILELRLKEYEPDIAYWEWQHDGTHFCSECGYDALEQNGKEFLSRCCPFCGKIMLIKDIEEEEVKEYGLLDV